MELFVVNWLHDLLVAVILKSHIHTLLFKQSYYLNLLPNMLITIEISQHCWAEAAFLIFL